MKSSYVILIFVVLGILIFGFIATGKFSGSVINENSDKLTLKLNIPCSGHSALVIDELEKINGIENVVFRIPDVFEIYYDSAIINEQDILNSQILKEYPQK